MLTKNDLTQIKTVVGDVIDDRLKKELKPINDKLDTHGAKFDQIDTQFDQINKKLIQHDTQFDQINKQFEKIDKRFGKVDKQFNKVNKDLKTIINYFDHNSLDHEARLTRIEKHLNLASS